MPDPGPRCRLAYAQLATMGTSSVVADLILVLFPIPVVLRSRMSFRRYGCGIECLSFGAFLHRFADQSLARKIVLILLFGLSLGTTATTLYRMPTLVYRFGNQQYRTLCASIEIFIATAASNILVLGSFTQERPPKKPRFRVVSSITSIGRPPGQPEQRPTDNESEGANRSAGVYTESAVEDAEVAHIARPSSITVNRVRSKIGPMVQVNRLDWPLPSPPISQSPYERHEILPAPMLPSLSTPSPTNPSTVSTAGVTFFDVGGLLEEGGGGGPPASVSSTPIIDLYASTPIVDYYAGSPTPEMMPMEFSELHPSAVPKITLQDLGGLLSHPRATPDLQASPPHSSASVSEVSTEDEPYHPIAADGPIRPRRVETSEFSHYAPSRPFSFEPLNDVGGLLSAYNRNR